MQGTTGGCEPALALVLPQVRDGVAPHADSEYEYSALATDCGMRGYQAMKRKPGLLYTFRMILHEVLLAWALAVLPDQKHKTQYANHLCPYLEALTLE